MSERTLVYGAAAVVVLLVLAGMAALHERHYRDRRGLILVARLGGMEARLVAVETILAEDRLT